jgi:hypothetical protein
LQGNNPSDHSKGALINGTDFHVISYKDDIKSWLEACLKESFDQPILRETIRQYLILIKKMTSTTDNQHQNQLLQVLSQNLQEAAYVSSNFEKAKQYIAENVRQSVITQLPLQLPNDLTVSAGVDISKQYAQVWVYYPEFGHNKVCFGIESFNGWGNHEGDLYIGIFNPNPNSISSFGVLGEDKEEYWSQISSLTLDGAKINLGDIELLSQIHSDYNFRKRLIDAIVNIASQYILQHKANLRTWLIANTQLNLKN